MEETLVKISKEVNKIAGAQRDKLANLPRHLKVEPDWKKIQPKDYHLYGFAAELGVAIRVGGGAMAMMPQWVRRIINLEGRKADYGIDVIRVDVERRLIVLIQVKRQNKRCGFEVVSKMHAIATGLRGRGYNIQCVVATWGGVGLTDGQPKIAEEIQQMSIGLDLFAQYMYPQPPPRMRCNWTLRQIVALFVVGVAFFGVERHVFDSRNAPAIMSEYVIDKIRIRNVREEHPDLLTECSSYDYIRSYFLPDLPENPPEYFKGLRSGFLWHDYMGVPPELIPLVLEKEQPPAPAAFEFG